MRHILLLLILFSLTPLMSRAEVADSAANGFTVKIATVIRAGPEAVYDRLVHNVGDWWSSDHTYSNDAHNLSLDDKVLGCFCEKLPGGGAVRHMQVIMVMPNKMLVMSGGLGPLQKFATTGTLTFALLPLHNDTRLEVTYAVGGYVNGGLGVWADPVNKMLTEQVTRFRSYVETGSPVPAGAKQP
jgi:uncharacterized protein YndB with AHSA1/START domain